jgi:glycosyltransferase involved in cell wall biosynthesis
MQENKKIKYSVIMPVHNRKSTIAEVLDTIFGLNNNTALEVIVFDDASDDGTQEILKKYPCKIIRSEEVMGPAAGRNRGAELASGDILIFIDSDVIVPHNTIDIVDKAINEGEADALIGVYSPKLRFRDYASNYKNLYQYYTYGFLPEHKTVPNFCSSLAVIKKKVFDELHGYDENFGLKVCEDTEFGERIAIDYKLYSCKELEFEHVKHYTYSQVLKTDFARAGSTIKIMLRKVFNKKETANAGKFRRAYSSLQKSYLYGIVLSALVLLFIAGGCIVNPVFFLLSFFSYCAIVISNRKFIKLIRENIETKNKLFLFVKTCSFLFADLVCMGLGIFINILSFAAGKKY